MSVIIKYEASEKEEEAAEAAEDKQEEVEQEKSLGPQAAALACLYLIVV